MNILTAIRNRFHPLWRIRRTPWLFNIFHRLDFPVWAKCSSLGMRMRVMWFRDMTWLFQSLPREPEFNRVIEQLCETFQPKVFWDVGANVGWFTWLVNARTSLTHAVLFEPFPLNAGLLDQTIAKNGFKHMRVVRSAVADRIGEVSFRVDDKSGATGQVAEAYDLSGDFAIARTYGLKTEITVPTTTMDTEIAAGAPVPDLIKMDIEEAEHLAIVGAAKLIALGRTIIAFECHRNEAIESMKAAGWAVFRVDDLHNYLAIPPQLIESAIRVTGNLARVA